TMNCRFRAIALVLGLIFSLSNLFAETLSVRALNIKASSTKRGNVTTIFKKGTKGTWQGARKPNPSSAYSLSHSIALTFHRAIPIYCVSVRTCDDRRFPKRVFVSGFSGPQGADAVVNFNETESKVSHLLISAQPSALIKALKIDFGFNSEPCVRSVSLVPEP